MDVDRQDMAVSLDVCCQYLAIPLNVGCPDGLSMKVHVASEKPMSTPSEHQLRCLLFCEGSDDTLDCCEHSKRHRLCHMNGLASDQADDEVPPKDTFVRLENPQDSLAASPRYDLDDRSKMLLRSLSTRLWTIESKQALKTGNFGISEALFKKTLEFFDLMSTLDAFAFRLNAKLPTFF